jgi:hypothetical protein
MHLDNNQTDNSQDIVDLFGKYFSSVYTQPLPNIHTNPTLFNSSVSLCNINITLSNVFHELDTLNLNLNCGPDNISPKFLFNCRFILSYPLHILFNKSLELGIFPYAWKTVYITPIYKKSDRPSILNYRPISKISIIPKIFSKIINNKIIPILNNLLINEQHGFRTKRSTVTNLAIFKQYIFDSFSSNTQTNVVYTDFEKAFDRVDHNLLIEKLKNYGINNPLLSWLNSFLKNCLNWKACRT